MSIAIAGTSGRSLVFAADTKFHRLDPVSRRISDAIGSKITSYVVGDSVLVAAYAGLWDPGSSDDAFLDVLGLWIAGEPSVAALSEELIRRLTRPLTWRAWREANARGLARNVSEFLIGWLPAKANAELWYVTRDSATPVPTGALHAIGGRDDWTLTQPYRQDGGEIDAPYVRGKLHEVLTTFASEAYDFPIEILEVTAAATRRTFYGRDGYPASTPPVVGHVPPQLPGLNPPRRRLLASCCDEHRQRGSGHARARGISGPTHR